MKVALTGGGAMGRILETLTNSGHEVIDLANGDQIIMNELPFIQSTLPEVEPMLLKFPYGSLCKKPRLNGIQDSLQAIARRFNGYKYFSISMVKSGDEFSKAEVYAHKVMPKEIAGNFMIGYSSRDSVYIGRIKATEPELYTRKELLKGE